MKAGKKGNMMNKELFLALRTPWQFSSLTNYEAFHRQFSHVIDDVTFEGDSALHIAASEGRQDIVDWIVRIKPSLVSAQNKDDNTPLHEAAKCGNPDVVRILLHRRKSPAEKNNKFGETPLIIASKFGHLETVKLLLEAKSNKTVLVTKLFRCFEEATQREILGATAHLFAAVKVGYVEIVDAILNDDGWHNDLVTEKDKFGRCVVHVAAIKGRWDIITLFQDKMPDCLEIRSSDHKSILYFAVEYNQIQIVRNLLGNKEVEKVVELISRDHDLFHNTVFHLAAKNGVDPQLVEYLVSFPGVDVNAVNDEDMTALGIASAAAKDNPNCAILVGILEGAGAIMGSLIPNSNKTSDVSNDSKQGRDTYIANTHMVVASLIATVTFSAIFQIPGRIEDDKNNIRYRAAKMALNTLFRLFIFSDIAAFASSLTVVVGWLLQPRSDETHVVRYRLRYTSKIYLLGSIIWTIVAFLSAIVIVTIPRDLEELRGKNNEAFWQYTKLLVSEIFIAMLTLYTVFTTVPGMFQLLTTNYRRILSPTFFPLVFNVLSLTFFLLLYTFR